MASLFQSFRSSSMPKRLLRYALSRFDILDAETLDMENLDLAWGMKTVLEFRDVGVKLKKLQKLLQLPPTFTLQKAKVLLLRVTLPVDIFSSPIQFEVSGVEVSLKISTREEDEEKQRKKREREKASDTAEVVPTAADLAQSFLEQQPSDEKKELEQALAAETQDLSASLAMSDFESDDDLGYGTGQALSLPAFLTDFLQGIVDRTQVRIEGVTFQLDVEVPVDAPTPGTATAASTVPELVTFQLALEGISVEGVTTQTQDRGSEAPAIVPKEGKRHISLGNVRAFLISEANVFASLSRTSSMAASQTSQSPAASTRSAFPSRAPTSHLPEDMEASAMGASSMADSDELFQNDYPLQDSEDAFNIPYEFENFNEETEGVGGGYDLDPPASSSSTPRASVYQEQPGPITTGYQHPAQSAVVGPEAHSWGSDDRGARSEPALRKLEQPAPAPNTDAARPQMEDSSHSSAGSGSSGVNESREDLSVSHVFSHEEAESMYMSAFSQTESVRLRNAMPGSWDVEEASPEPSPVAPRSYLPTGGASLKEEAAPETAVAASPPRRSPEPARPEEATPRGGADRGATPTNDLPGGPDEAPTPRGPTRIVKEVLSLKSVSVYVPLNHQHIQVPVTTSTLGKSVSPHLPGAFSVHAASASDQQSVVLEQPQESREGKENPDDGSIEIILAPVEVRFDASIGFLLAKVVAKIQESFKTEPGSGNSAKDTRTAAAAAKKPSMPLPEIKVTAEKISLLFLEKLAGIADTAERFFEPKTPAPEFSQDTLLQAIFENLTVASSSSQASTATVTETSVSLERFRFGYVDADIVTFDRRAQMRASVRDAFPPAGADVSVKLTQTTGPGGSTKCAINTLPLRVIFDLQRLDETFSWFGGLSSFLNVSSSVTSNAGSTTAGGGKALAKPAQKPRGVRFEGAPATVAPLEETSTASGLKVDMRIGGFQLALVGKDCTVSLDTSAVKLVSRDEGIGIGLSKVRLAGPRLRNSRAEPPINVEITNTRLDYSMTPEDKDLERLLELITPSKVKFDEDDVVMVDTLLRQRRKGPILRLNFDDINVGVRDLAQLSHLPALGEEIARLGTVAKYLPEDDRPGLLTLGLIRKLDLSVDVGGRFGAIQATLKDFETAHISIPSLVSFAVNDVTVRRNETEELVGSSTASSSSSNAALQGPVLRMRMIGDEMEPVIKVKMRGLNIEYRVPTLMDIMDLAADTTPQEFEASLAASVANLGEQAHSALTGGRGPSEGLASRAAGKSPAAPASATKPTTVDLAFHDCILGLNPLGAMSKLNIVLVDSRVEVVLPREDKVRAVAHLNKVSLLLIDDVSLAARDIAFAPAHGHRASVSAAPQSPSGDVVKRLCARGYVNICQISSAKATINATTDHEGRTVVDVELRDDLLVLETCADSTQTLITLANRLAPPTPPSKEIKFKTEVMPVQDLLASISLDAFGRAEGNYNFEDDFAVDDMPSSSGGGGGGGLGGYDDDLDDIGSSPMVLSYSGSVEELEVAEKLFDASSMMSDRTATQADVKSHGSSSPSDLSLEEDFFGSAPAVEGTAHRWNSSRNEYDKVDMTKVMKAPLVLRVRDVHAIWNLFDGYDWQKTRDEIAKTVQEVENKALERRMRSRRRSGYEQDFDEEETVIGDFLFNSIYIGIAGNHDPRELTQAINQNVYGDTTADTESVATMTTATATSSRAGGAHRSRKRLKLNRSRRHKITFEVAGLNADVVLFPPGSGETTTSIDVRIQDLEIFDHVPTSTWKKFLTYDRDAGERPIDNDMVHAEILIVKPVPELAATEFVIKARLLPLRLHVDQDALDFIVRFISFKDESAPPTHASPSDVPFIQRAEVLAVPVQLDFKPKRVDYAGLRSGHTTEFMNFIILDSAHMVMRHTIIYGVSGFDKLGQQFNNIWMPDIQRHQLPGVLAGLAPVRSLVNVGSGFRDLIEIPIQEYRRNGRIVRSISKGAAAFAKTTGTELVKLGAKVATGTQYMLQGAEGMLVQDPEGRNALSAQTGGLGDEGFGGEEDDASDAEENRHLISLYADQPTGVVQGLRHAYRSLARDINLTRDAIIAVPAEVRESNSATGAARAVIKHAPTIIFRPAIGATKAIGQTLLGATNSLDPQNLRRMEDKYKSGPRRM